MRGSRVPIASWCAAAPGSAKDRSSAWRFRATRGAAGSGRRSDRAAIASRGERSRSTTSRSASATTRSSRAHGMTGATPSPPNRSGTRSAISGTGCTASECWLRRELGAAALAVATLICAAQAQDPEKLTSGPGATLTAQKCQICHELGHVTRSRLSRGEWADNLKNMRERGAPLTDAEVEVIVGYLAAYYGRDPAPAPAPDTLAATGNDPIAKLLADNGCTACHDVTQRIVGPAFREVAQKYAGDPAAA